MIFETVSICVNESLDNLLIRKDRSDAIIESFVVSSID